MLSGVSLFGVFVQEREPLRFSEFGRYLMAYLQDAGGVAAVALIAFLIFQVVTGFSDRSKKLKLPLWLIGCVLVSVVLLVAAGGLRLLEYRQQEEGNAVLDPNEPGAVVTPLTPARNVLHAAGGAVALIGLLVPFILDMRKLSGRRIYALAKL